MSTRACPDIPITWARITRLEAVGVAAKLLSTKSVGAARVHVCELSLVECKRAHTKRSGTSLRTYEQAPFRGVFAKVGLHGSVFFRSVFLPFGASQNGDGRFGGECFDA